MIVGIGGWGFRELPFERHCRIARDFGFRYIELGIGRGEDEDGIEGGDNGAFPGLLPRDMSPRRIGEVRSCLAEHGLKGPFVYLDNDFTLADRVELARNVERTLRDIRLAHALGATHVRLFSGFAPASEMTEARWQSMLDAFREADRLCASLGLAIAIETHGRLTRRGAGVVHDHTTSTDRESVRRLLRELPERVGFNFDPGNLKPFGESAPLECARLLESRVNYCHLKDWKRKGEAWVACGVGDDDLDWKALLAAVDYDGVYLIEYEPTDDLEDGIRRSLAHLRGLYPDLRMQ